MVKVAWTHHAVQDLGRLHEFLKVVNPTAAAKILQNLVKAPNAIIGNPRMGERIEAFESREIRRLLVARYELRYEIRDATLYILRIWHTREER
jgi:plasmid stabilization system protein ParE